LGELRDNYSFESNTGSSYNSLQLSVRHTTPRLYVFAGYTYSKSMDNTSNLQDKTPNPLNPAVSYGLSSFDVTHNFVVSYSYVLPSIAWLMGGITASRRAGRWWNNPSGYGLSDRNGGNRRPLFACNTLGADTPDFLGGNLNFQNPRKANVTTGVPYFNTALFAPSAIGQEGSANRPSFTVRVSTASICHC